MMRMVKREVACICAAVFFVTTAHTAHAGINVWTSRGPRGGGVVALAIDPVTPSTLYIGADGGVFKSTDAGATWSALNIDLTNYAGVTVLAMDPTTPSTLYAGTTNVYGGEGVAAVFKSIDAGATWSATGLVTSTTGVSALAVDPITPSTLYAGTHAPCGEEGCEFSDVYRSTDGGRTWNAATVAVPQIGVTGFAFNPTTPGTLYAGTIFGGVLKSMDAGVTWTATGLTNTSVLALAIDPVTSSILYAGTNDGTFKSADAGATWSAANSGLPGSGSVSALTIDPIAPSTLFAGTSDYGVFKSTDAGASWRAVNVGLTHYTSVVALAIANAPNTLYAVAGGGVFRSTDGGATWVARGLLNTVVNALAIDPVTPTTVYAGTAGSVGGPGAIVFKSTDAAGSWDGTGLGMFIVTSLVINPITPSTLYAGSDYGVLKSTDGGDTWNRGGPALGSLTIDPVTPGTLYAAHGSGGVFKSTDAGATWDDTGLTNAVALAIDPITPTTLYAVGNGVFKTMDGGATWNDTGLTNTFLKALAIDPLTPSTLYAAAGSTVIVGLPSVFKSTDAGATWNALGINFGVNALAIDPITPTTLYAAGASVFKSTDAGATWSALNTGLTNGDVRALVIDPMTPSRLYVGTNGGGVFSIEQVATCTGDCNVDGRVTVDELVKGVTIALGTAPIEDCPEFACHGSNDVSVDCLIQGVNAALDVCVAR